MSSSGKNAEWPKNPRSPKTTSVAPWWRVVDREQHNGVRILRANGTRFRPRVGPVLDRTLGAPEVPATRGETRAGDEKRLPARDRGPIKAFVRDAVDGRPRGHLRKFGLSRVRMRELAHQGQLPGIRKASW